MKESISRCRNILKENLGSYVDGVADEHIDSFVSAVTVHKILFKDAEGKSQLYKILEDLWRIAAKPKFSENDIAALFKLPDISMYEYKKTYTPMDETLFRKILAVSIASDSKQNIYSKSIRHKLYEAPYVKSDDLVPSNHNGTKELNSDIEKYLSSKVSSIADNLIPEIKTRKDPRILELVFKKPVPDITNADKIKQDFSTIMAKDSRSGRYIAFSYKNWGIDNIRHRETGDAEIYTVKYRDNVTEEKICHIQIWYAILKTVFSDKRRKDLAKSVVAENKELIDLMSEERIPGEVSFAEWGEKVLDNNKTFKKIPAPSKKDKEYKHQVHQILNYLFKHADDITHAMMKTLSKEDKSSAETLNTVGKIIWLACRNSRDMITLTSPTQCGHRFTKHLAENTNICHVIRNKKLSKYTAKEYNKFLENLPERIGLAAKTSIQFESLMQGTLTEEKPANALPA